MISLQVLTEKKQKTKEGISKNKRGYIKIHAPSTPLHPALSLEK